MSADLPTTTRLKELLASFDYPEVPPESLQAQAREFIRRAPPVPGNPEELGQKGMADLLQARLQALVGTLSAHRNKRRGELLTRNLKSRDSLDILHAHSLLYDLLHRAACEAAMEELPLLMALRQHELERDLAYKRGQLPGKEEKLTLLTRQLNTPLETQRDPEELTYYRNYAVDLEREVQELQVALKDRQLALAELETRPDVSAAVQTHLVVFARGGYGRGELGFGSDIDNGYCLDTRKVGVGVAAILREWVVRIETLLNESGVVTAHQYFEVDEDLSRFTAPETLHAIPSVLESRALFGAAPLLKELKHRFLEVLPFEGFVRKKSDEYQEQAMPSLTTMDLKEDLGGLRSVQVPLWLLGASRQSTDFSTSSLFRLGLAQGILSPVEALRLLTALAFLHELRNFSAGAEERYFDQEARESGFVVPRIHPNCIDDAMARLYLFRKPVFDSLDRFDGYRLRLVDEVQTLSRLLMRRVLDRTLTHQLKGCQVAVHLGAKQIIAITALEGRSITELYQESAPLLELMVLIAQSDYGLSPELIDTLVAVVRGLRLPDDDAGREQTAEYFTALMVAPYAHRALGILFQINDPTTAPAQTLMGRFIPEYDNAFFLLRRHGRVSLLLHEHLLKALNCGQQGLDWLQKYYPELRQQLKPVDVLALKWSLFLQGLRRVPREELTASHAAETGAEVLSRLGYRDIELERRVRLLIEHGHTLSGISRVSTYFDQALSRYFELAERRTENVTLLYLVNRAILQAGSPENETELSSLQRLFTEAVQILAEMRGIPRKERSLELINVYMDHKKEDLLADTRLHLVMRKILSLGVRAAVITPLTRESALNPQASALTASLPELEALHRALTLGNALPAERERTEEKLLTLLRSRITPEVAQRLTTDEEQVFSWFFASYPNRYLLSVPPRHLAGELHVFSRFQETRVIADIVDREQLGGDGLLISTHGLSRPH
ncbi:MAG: hypothetical protein OEW39_01665, partial [Deltaproteobacteria bacterium]|nr:hypothetical protein [Deltaproteobacteria bacterium]